MGLRNGILIRKRKKHIRIGNKFDCVEGVKRDAKEDLPDGKYKILYFPFFSIPAGSVEKSPVST